jgi:hypothetical protein
MLRRCVTAGLAVMMLALAFLPATASAADPFVLFLLRMLRDQALSSAIESGATALPKARALAPSIGFPQEAPEAERLRRLIDESFVHLRSQQREDLHATLLRILNDPKNAQQRAEIMAAFVAQAEGTRRAHAQLSRLSPDEIRVVAAEARVEFARLSPGEQRELLLALEHGVPGMPQTLHEAILAEFRSVPSAR